MNLNKVQLHAIRSLILIGLFSGVSLMASAAQTITVWVGDGQVRLQEYQVVAQLFEKQNPGVKVDLQLLTGNQTTNLQKLAVAMASGSAPDVTWIEGSTIAEFASKGFLMDVTRVLDGLKFAPADTQEMTYNGKMWAVPYHTAVRGLFKRIDFLEQAGINPNVDPASLEELYTWNQKLTKIGGDGKYTQVGIVPWVGNWGAPAWAWSFGGQLVEIKGSKIIPTATHPKNVAALEWIRNWAQSVGSTTPVTGGANGLVAGTVAMSAESSSLINRLRTANIPFTTGRVPHAQGGQNGTWGGGTAVAVPVGTSNPQLALKLARFFGETSVQLERFAVAPDTLPSNWQALLTVGRKMPKEMTALLDQFPEARPRPPLWVDYYVNQLQPAMNQVVAGTKTPLQALTDVQTVMEARYQETFK